MTTAIPIYYDNKPGVHNSPLIIDRSAPRNAWRPRVFSQRSPVDETGWRDGEDGCQS